MSGTAAAGQVWMLPKNKDDQTGRLNVIAPFQLEVENEKPGVLGWSNEISTLTTTETRFLIPYLEYTNRCSGS